MDILITIAFLLSASVFFMVPNSHAMDNFGMKKGVTHVETTVINGYSRKIELLAADRDDLIITGGKVSPGSNLTWSVDISPYNYKTVNHTCVVSSIIKHKREPDYIGSFPVFDAEVTYLGHGIGAVVEIVWRVNDEGASEKDLDSDNFELKHPWRPTT